MLAQQGEHPLAALVFFIAAGLLALDPQPVYLAMTSVLWGLSLTALLPGVNQATASDPIALMFGAGFLESVALAVVRLLLMMMSWSQFLFYRLLYGTARFDADLPAIPEVVPNQTNRLALMALGLAGASVLSLLVGSALRDSAQLSYSLATPAIGIALGVAFSPTDRRGFALAALIAATILSLFSLQRMSLG